MNDSQYQPADLDLQGPTPNSQTAEGVASRCRRRDLAWRVGVGIWALGVVLLSALTLRGQEVDWPSESPPRPLAAREVKFPPYEIRTLPNGMQVIAVLHHEQPAITMRMLVRAGASRDPTGKAGVAMLASALLDQGTKTKSAEEIADRIDFIGGALGTGAGSDLSYVNAVVMKDSFSVGLELIADVIREPAFDPEEIERQKQQAVSRLQVNSKDPEWVADVVFDRLVYGFHPYGLPSGGTPETLAGITRDDLQAFHRRYFVPNNIILAIVGDVTGPDAFAEAERVFGRWPRVELPPSPSIEPPPSTRRLVVVDKPDSVQTEIRVGHIGIPRKHPDYMAIDLALRILGGEGANRLHRVLRTERGLTYGATVDLEARKQTGDFLASTDTRTETTGETLRLILDEIEKLQRERVSGRELSDAQAYLAGTFPLTIETPNDIAAQVLNAVFFELPLKEMETFRERVQAVTPDDIQRVARQYLHPDRLSIVLVGNASGFVPQLRAVGFADPEVIPIDQLDLMSASLKTEAKRQALGWFGSVGSFDSPGWAYTATQVNPRTPARPNAPNVPNAPNDLDARDLLKRVIEAKGGLDALKRIRTVVAEEDRAVVTPRGPTPLPTKTYVVYPDKFRIDSLLAGQPITHTYNSGSAWLRDLHGVSAAPPAMRDDFAATARRDTYPMLIAAADGKLSVRLLPEEGAEGAVLKVLEISGVMLPPVRLYIDRDFRIAREGYAGTSPDGKPIEIQEVFSDYRKIDGVDVPFRASVLQNGRVIIERTIKTVTFNGTIDAKLFEQPL